MKRQTHITRYPPGARLLVGNVNNPTASILYR